MMEKRDWIWISAMFIVVALVGGTLAFTNGMDEKETHSESNTVYVSFSVSAMSYDDLVTMCVAGNTVTVGADIEITGDLTVPSGCKVVIPNGRTLSYPGTGTLTIADGGEILNHGHFEFGGAAVIDGRLINDQVGGGTMNVTVTHTDTYPKIGLMLGDMTAGYTGVSEFIALNQPTGVDMYGSGPEIIKVNCKGSDKARGVYTFTSSDPTGPNEYNPDSCFYNYDGLVYNQHFYVVSSGTLTVGIGDQDAHADIYDYVYGDDVTVGVAGLDENPTVTYAVKSGAEFVSVDPSTGKLGWITKGTAIVTATFAATEDYNPGSIDITVNTYKASIPSFRMEWDYDGPFIYDGTPKSVTVKGLPDGVTVKEYVDNTATEVGSYTASVKSWNYDDVHYEEPLFYEKCNWSIEEKPPAYLTKGSQPPTDSERESFLAVFAGLILVLAVTIVIGAKSRK